MNLRERLDDFDTASSEGRNDDDDVIVISDNEGKQLQGEGGLGPSQSISRAPSSTSTKVRDRPSS